MDPRTTIARTQDYMGALGEGVRGLRIAVLKEGFAHEVSDRDTSAKVRAAIDELKGLGAEVEEVSVPLHYDGPHIWTAIILEGAAEMMIKGYALGNNWPGYYATSLVDAFARGFHTRLDDASETVKLVLLLGEYMHRQYHGRYHAKGQNLRWLLRDAIRPGAARPRSDDHADDPVPGDQDPAAGLPARGVRRPRSQHAA